MKKLFTLLLLSLFVAVCGQVDANEYEKIFSSKNVIVDVRTPSEYLYDHLNKAINIPFNKIEAEIKYYAPDKDQTIVVYCTSGSRARIAEKKLKEMGYTDVINAGKLKDLKAAEEKLNKSDTGR
jgi:phage shock protein E